MAVKMRPRDRARAKSDLILESTEKKMGRIYDTDPALVKIEKKLLKYLNKVGKDTAELYKAYKNAEPDDKADAKKAYMEAMRKLTFSSKEYTAIMDEYADAIAGANAKALDIANDAMIEVYTISYNQVADECKRVGIKVNGKE